MPVLSLHMKVKTKSKKVNKAWLHDHITDPTSAGAGDGYRSRAAYKLKEIDETLQPPDQAGAGGGRPRGSAPGAWSQYLRRALRPRWRGRAVRPSGLDGTHPGAGPAAHGAHRRGCSSCRATSARTPWLQRWSEPLGGRPVDVVVSDMAPNLSGIESADAARMAHLVELAVEFAAART
jgi:23S rRNA (uridine2552-2'-O)-methyltransferase